MSAALPPVITIDGPAASGKGTVAKLVAKTLGFQLLDSGKLYRAAALTAIEEKLIDAEAGDSGGGGGAAAAGAAVQRILADAARREKLYRAVSALTAAPARLAALLQDPRLTLPPAGRAASALAADPALRCLLLPLQQAQRRPPGLVADGRDMGTVVFPDAPLRVFLTADAQTRAERRWRQLRENGNSAILAEVYQDLKARDEQDSTRAAAPLKPPQGAGAFILNSTRLSIGDAAEEILRAYRGIAF